MSIAETVATGLIALLSVIASLVALRLLSRPAGVRPGAEAEEIDDETLISFDGDELTACNDAGRAMMDALPADRRNLAGFLELVNRRFPRLAERLGEGGSLRSIDGALTAELQCTGRRTDFRIRAAASGAPAVERAVFDAIQAELSLRRENAALAPFAEWRVRPGGEVTWANAHYLDLVRRVADDVPTRSWPPLNLFPAITDPVDAPRRVRLTIDEKDAWFDVVAKQTGGEMICTALSAQGLVRAERRLAEFTQTFSKTFAELSVGLAIFDAKRRLVMFNPFLTATTGLSAEFLAARPTLVGFLDKLRELGRTPEPKNYAAWRRQMIELEEAATGGTYCENWPLLTGQTFRVMGRPQPDGAIAFIFEDITAEISFARVVRSEIEVAQSVIDSLDEAIAVFSADGVLRLSNAAYQAIWVDTPEAVVGETRLADCSRQWLDRTLPTPVWGDAREFAQQTRNRAEWYAEVQLRNGLHLNCRFAPVAGGSTLFGFTPVQQGIRVVERRLSLTA